MKGRQKLRCKKFNAVKEKFFVAVEKLLKSGKASNYEEHLAFFASATNGKPVKLLGTIDFDSGTGLNQAPAIKNMLEEWNIEERCVAMCLDTTASNTGKFAGTCILLEALIGYSLLWTSCRHHMLEFILGDVFKAIFGPTSSPKVDFFDIRRSSGDNSI